jgi:hypothetical protein
MPTVSEVRNRIEKKRDTAIKMLFKTVLLYALRIGEACGYRYKSEKNAQPTGMLLWASNSEWQPNMMNYNEVFILQSIALMDNGTEPSREEISKIREKAFVLSIVTEKREGFNRQAAIPMNEIYERWSPEVYKYITERQKKGPLPHLQKLNLRQSKRVGKPLSMLITVQSKAGQSIIENYEPIFPYKRQEVWPIAKDLFKGFSYPIADYRRRIGTEIKDGKKVGVYELIPPHQMRFGNHALRHLRATELKTFFLIEKDELSSFMGWTKSRASATSPMEPRYVSEPWKAAGYFPKLLRKRA